MVGLPRGGRVHTHGDDVRTVILLKLPDPVLNVSLVSPADELQVCHRPIAAHFGSLQGVASISNPGACADSLQSNSRNHVQN